MELDPESVKLAAWHIESLVKGGFESDYAGRLAVLDREQILSAISMLAQGCSQELIEKIVA